METVIDVFPKQIQNLIDECAPDYEIEIVEVFNSTNSIDTTIKSVKVAYALKASPGMISRSKNLNLLYLLANESNFILSKELDSQLKFLIKYKTPITLDDYIVKNGGTINIGAIDMDNNLERIKRLSIGEEFELSNSILHQDAKALNDIYLGSDEWSKVIAKVYNQNGKILYKKHSNNEYEVRIVYPKA